MELLDCLTLHDWSCVAAWHANAHSHSINAVQSKALLATVIEDDMPLPMLPAPALVLYICVCVTCRRADGCDCLNFTTQHHPKDELARVETIAVALRVVGSHHGHCEYSQVQVACTVKAHLPFQIGTYIIWGMPLSQLQLLDVTACSLAPVSANIVGMSLCSCRCTCCS